MPYFAIPEGESSAAEAELAAALDGLPSMPAAGLLVVVLDLDGNVLFLAMCVGHAPDGWW